MRQPGVCRPGGSPKGFSPGFCFGGAVYEDEGSALRGCLWCMLAACVLAGVILAAVQCWP